MQHSCKSVWSTWMCLTGSLSNHQSTFNRWRLSKRSIWRARLRISMVFVYFLKICSKYFHHRFALTIIREEKGAYTYIETMLKRMCCDVLNVNPTQAARFWATQINPNWLRWLPGNLAMMTTLWRVAACQLISTNTQRGAKQYSPTDLKWERWGDAGRSLKPLNRKKKKTDLTSQMQVEYVWTEEAEGSQILWQTAERTYWDVFVLSSELQSTHLD